MFTTSISQHPTTNKKTKPVDGDNAHELDAGSRLHSAVSGLASLQRDAVMAGYGEFAGARASWWIATGFPRLPARIGGHTHTHGLLDDPTINCGTVLGWVLISNNWLL